MSTVHISIELPDEIVHSLYENPHHFVAAMRVAAAVKWYELEKLSQAKAAEVAGLSRAEFIEALNEYGVSPFQVGADEIIEEAKVG